MVVLFSYRQKWREDWNQSGRMIVVWWLLLGHSAYMLEFDRVRGLLVRGFASLPSRSRARTGVAAAVQVETRAESTWFARRC